MSVPPKGGDSRRAPAVSPVAPTPSEPTTPPPSPFPPLFAEEQPPGHPASSTGSGPFEPEEPPAPPIPARPGALGALVPARSFPRPSFPDREAATDLLRRAGVQLWTNDFHGYDYLGEHAIDDGLLVDLAVELSKPVGMSFHRNAVDEALGYLARKNRRHPLADLLRDLVWDGTERLSKLLPTYFGTKDDPLHRAIGVMWGVGAVSRPLNPGDKIDYTLILIGEQGTGKSTAVRLLPLRPEWCNDTPVDLKSKDARIALRGTWLMELDSLKRSELATLKTIASKSAVRATSPMPVTTSPQRQTTASASSANA